MSRSVSVKKIVIFTSSELRHEFFRKYIAQSAGIKVVNTYCEGLEKNLRTVVDKDPSNKDLRLKHLEAREQAEEDFFRLFVDATPDKSNPVFLPKGEINSPAYTQAIIDSNPDLLVAYGCSIIKEPLLNAFAGRFLNVHLGLSPYYRGSGTNYWPLVNAEPEYVGATFMHIDAGIDTGEIIHQIRAAYCWGDSPAQIGNRLIVAMSDVYRRIIVNFDSMQKLPQMPVPENERVCKMKDYTEESVALLYKNFANGLIERYLGEEAECCDRVPILRNPGLETAP